AGRGGCAGAGRDGGWGGWLRGHAAARCRAVRGARGPGGGDGRVWGAGRAARRGAVAGWGGGGWGASRSGGRRPGKRCGRRRSAPRRPAHRNPARAAPAARCHGRGGGRARHAAVGPTAPHGRGCSMTFRSKLLLACVPLALAPVAIFGLRVRGEVVGRLEAQYGERVTALADVIQADLAREAAAVGARLDRVAEAIAADNRLRRALLDGADADRAYVLDYAGHAMGLVGLDVLRIQSAGGRVLSSGHFRNEYDVVDAALPAAVARAGDAGALAAVRTASGEVLALARARELRLGGRVFTLVGGTVVDAAFLDRLARGTGLGVRLDAPAEAAGVVAPEPAEGAAVGEYTRAVTVSFAGAGQDTVARFVVHASLEPLAALRAQMDRWLVVAAAAAAALALLLASFVAARLSRPLAELARRAGRVDLDDPDASFATRR